MLSPYRVLDLARAEGSLCGKLFGDLGADVIKIEPPGGDPARGLGPFCEDDPHPEKSLFWFAFNTSKRGITLSIETADGQHIFRKLAETADFVVETFPPGYMERLGLGHSALEETNPGVITVSITPFGQTGPYKDYKGPSMVAWALGGQMDLYGYTDRPPVHVSYSSQAHLLSAVAGAAGAMTAFQARRTTGHGRHVDVSVQETTAWMTEWPAMHWDTIGLVAKRGRRTGANTRIRLTHMWPCKDGHVIYYYRGGFGAGRVMQPFIAWLEDEGRADKFLLSLDWETLDYRTVDQETISRIEKPIGEFFKSYTKAELYEAAVERRVMLYPVSTTRDIVESPQVAARGFWTPLEHPELGTTINYPGAFFRASETPVGVRNRAPLIGEHNQEIYEREMGLSRDEILTLKQAGVI